jgi:hypothetical protein
MLAGACLAGEGCSGMAQNVWIKRALLVVLLGIVTIVEVNFVGHNNIFLKIGKYSGRATRQHCS